MHMQIQPRRRIFHKGAGLFQAVSPVSHIAASNPSDSPGQSLYMQHIYVSAQKALNVSYLCTQDCCLSLQNLNVFTFFCLFVILLK